MDTRSGETWNVSGTTIIVVFGSVLCNILYCIVNHSLSSVDVGMVGRTTLKPHVPYV